MTNKQTNKQTNDHTFWHRYWQEFVKGVWSLAPEPKPDIYTSYKIGQWVSFYTDLDSISYKIHQLVPRQ